MAGLRRAFVVALVLSAPVLVLPTLADALAERVAPPVGRQLASVAQLVASLRPPPRATPKPLPLTPDARAIGALRALPDDDSEASPAQQTPRAHASAAPEASPPLPARGVLVRKERVLAAARSGIRPSGYAVPATATRPAGVALVGAGALGVGLRDGDVLTHVNGQPVASPNLVVAMAAGALRSGATSISGEVWRGHHRLTLTVELPRVRMRPRVSTERPTSR